MEPLSAIPPKHNYRESSMEKFLGICLGLFIILLVVNAVSALLALFLHLAWSYVAVPVFHAPVLTFFQVWIATGALSVLAALFRRSK